jgi:hypothetical protein
MKLADYPLREPPCEAGQAYCAECWRRSEGIPCREVAFGPNLAAKADDLEFKGGRAFSASTTSATWLRRTFTFVLPGSKR